MRISDWSSDVCSSDLLLGLHRPADGRILIDGTSLAEIDLANWRGMLGYVPQELVLFNDSVAANVTLGDATLSDARVEHALADAGSLQFVESLTAGIHPPVGERCSRLPEGQPPRTALARAPPPAPNPSTPTQGTRTT